MRTSERRLAAAEAALSSPMGAYVARTRLKRAILTVVAEIRGLSLEESSAGVDVESSARSRRHEEAAEVCRRLIPQVERMCGPSDCFDRDWVREAVSLASDVRRLRMLVARL